MVGLLPEIKNTDKTAQREKSLCAALYLVRSVLFLGLSDAVKLLVHLKQLLLGKGDVHHSDHA